MTDIQQRGSADGGRGRAPMLRLRPMTQAEYEAWVPSEMEDYARAHVRAGSMPADTALELAKEQFASLLPDGVASAHHYLLVGEDEERPDARVGVVWLHIPDKPEPSAFVYDVVVEPAARGSGYGRAIMLAAEDFARDRGAATMQLHVFGDNAVAIRLYQSLGYETTHLSMAKPLA